MAFGVLAALLFLVADGDLGRRGLWSVSITAAYGVATELNQAFGTTGRHGSTWDVLSDVVGGVMFAAALVWVRSGSRRALGLALAMLPLAAGTTAMATWVAP